MVASAKASQFPNDDLSCGADAEVGQNAAGTQGGQSLIRIALSWWRQVPDCLKRREPWRQPVRAIRARVAVPFRPSGAGLKQPAASNRATGYPRSLGECVRGTYEEGRIQT